MFKTLVSGILSGSMVLGSMYVLPAYAQQVEAKKHQANEIECMALNIYFETRAVSLADAVAVSDVVMNRVKDNRFPNTVCRVVKQGKQKPSWKDPNKMVMKRNACQFSWYCDGKADTPKNAEAWERSRKLARDIYVHGQHIGITEGSTHYHATYVKPYWAPNMDRVARIGSHIFYRMK